MGAISEGAPQEVVDDLRDFVNDNGVIALALLFEDDLDRRAGRWKLTDVERDIRTACRMRYGLYDPSHARQARFISRYMAAYGRTLVTGPWKAEHLHLATTVTWAA